MQYNPDLYRAAGAGFGVWIGFGVGLEYAYHVIYISLLPPVPKIYMYI